MTPDWIAIDWGTTHLRVWAMGPDGQKLDMRCSDKGMSTLANDEFAPELARITEGWPADIPAIACGMVGSRQGWVEAPYTSVPCEPHGAGMVMVPGAGRPVWVIPGLKQAAPSDVMRGEETQIAGFIAANPKWDGVLCLPGTHTKWVEISAGEVVSFRTYMTGEMFALLSKQSVLRHSVAEGWDDAWFLEAVSDAISRPEKLASGLFTLRADDLLNGQDHGTARARLSGLLIGSELAASRPYWLGQQVALIGEEGLCDIYAKALTHQGITPARTSGELMTLAGLCAAYKTIKD